MAAVIIGLLATSCKKETPELQQGELMQMPITITASYKTDNDAKVDYTENGNTINATWINSHISTIFLGNGEGEYYKGVGVQLDDDLEESYWDGTDVYLYEMGMLTFQIDSDGDYALYDFKKIEIYYDYDSFSGNLPDGAGWSNDGSKLTWEGDSTSTVGLWNEGPESDHMDIIVTQVVFTLEKTGK